MSNAITNFKTIHNNVFIFSPLFVWFYSGLGRKPKSILLSYLVLPFVLPLETRRSLKNSNVTSTIFTLLSKNSIRRGLIDRLRSYKELTNHCIQYLIDMELISIDDDSSVVVLSTDIEVKFSPPAACHAAKKFGVLLKIYDIPAIYRLMQIRKL